MAPPLPRIQAPTTLQTTLGGFRFVVPARVQARPLVRPAVIGTLASLAGIGLGMALTTTSAWAGEVVAATSTVVGAMVLATLLDQGRRLADVDVRLEGRLLAVGSKALPLTGPVESTIRGEALVVRSDAGELAIPGPKPWLRWLAAQLLTLEPLGSIDEVPLHLQGAARRRLAQAPVRSRPTDNPW